MQTNGRKEVLSLRKYDGVNKGTAYFLTVIR